jgi:hypothetical protein
MPHPRAAAERVLHEVGVVHQADLRLLELIAWERNALVQYKHIDGAEARLAVVGEKAIITVSTTIEDPYRQRFSIAHELGHLEMHRSNNSLELCTGEDIDNWRSRRASATREQEANEFASALLLPEQFFSPLCRKKEPSLDLIGELADNFQVSLTATALRFVYFCTEPCAVVFSQHGIITWFQGSKDFEDLGLFIDVSSRLDRSSYAARFFQGDSIPSARQRVSASSWFTSGRYRKDASIYEQSWPMPKYDAVLTLLWIFDVIDDEESDY